MDKISYALGLGIGQQIKNMHIEGFSIEDFSQSIRDIIEGNPTAMSSREAQQMLNQYFEKQAKEQAQQAIAEGKVFLEENARRPEVTQTKSGLQYRKLREGNGKRPTANSTVKVHYKGTLLDGTVFDSSYDRGEPMEFPVGAVIPGWTEGLQLMDEGSKYMLYIPYNLGYGENPVGDIPPGSTLTFEVELIEILK